MVASLGHSTVRPVHDHDPDQFQSRLQDPHPSDGAIGAASRPKKPYTTFVVEREIAAPRAVAFDTVCNLINEATGGPVTPGQVDPRGLGARFEFTLGELDLSEEVISFEPPWRRVYELSGAPVVLYQGTTAFTDQGERCLMAWSVVIDPLPNGASDTFLTEVEPFLTRFADGVKVRAEAA